MREIWEPDAFSTGDCTREGGMGPDVLIGGGSVAMPKAAGEDIEPLRESGRGTEGCNSFGALAVELLPLPKEGAVAFGFNSCDISVKLSSSFRRLISMLFTSLRNGTFVGIPPIPLTPPPTPPAPPTPPPC